MIKKYLKKLKKAGACILAMAMVLGMIPGATVHAAEYDVTMPNVGDTLSAGDVMNGVTGYKYVNIVYFSPNGETRIKVAYDNVLPYTIETVEHEGVTYSSWKVSKKTIDDVGEQVYYDLHANGNESPAGYTASLNVENLQGATASLTKETGITADDTVTLTVTPDEGKAFTSAPYVKVTNATLGSPSPKDDGTITYKITKFTANAVIKVVGEAG